MHRTPFAGLTELDDGDPLLIDGGSFTQTNPSKIDRLLQVGAVSHRHDAHVALSDPLRAPSASVDPTGGSIPAETTIYVGYTVEDGQGGETRLSPVVNGTTDLPLNAPSGGILASGDYSAGSLMIGNYYYGITFLDGAGGETPLGPTAAFARNPGAASAQVHLSGLATELNPPLGPVAWRLWRSQNGQQFQLLASGTSDTFLDNGVQCTDCTVQPPSPAPGGNTTRQTSLLHVTLPTPAQEPVVGSGTSHGGLIRLYLSTDGLFGSPSFYNAYPLSSAGADIQIPFLSVDTGSPPDVSTCVPGASQINPDTDIFDWHWKRPVPNVGNLPSGSQGDVRLVIGTGVEYGVLGASAFGPSDWTALGSGIAAPSLAVGGPGVLNPTLQQRIALAFMGSGGTGVAVTDLGGGSAQILISGPAPSPVPIVQPTIAGSAGVPKLLNKPYLEIAASGGRAVPGLEEGDVADWRFENLGGGSARAITAARGMGNILLSPALARPEGGTLQDKNGLSLGSGFLILWTGGPGFMQQSSGAIHFHNSQVRDDPGAPNSALEKGAGHLSHDVVVASGQAGIFSRLYDRASGGILTSTQPPDIEMGVRIWGPSVRSAGGSAMAHSSAGVRLALEGGSGMALRTIFDSLGQSDFKPKEIIGNTPFVASAVGGGGPYHGQEIYYLPDPVNQPGIRRHLVYNAWSTSPNKWEFVGGTAQSTKMHASGAQSIPDNTWTTVTLGVKNWDIGGMADTANGRIVVREAGKYTAIGWINFAGNATGNRGVGIAVNGVRIGEILMPNLGGILSVTFDAMLALDLQVGDVVTLMGWQNSGAPLNSQATTDNYPSLSLVKQTMDRM